MIFNNHINEESVAELIQKLKDELATEQTIDLIFSTSGGDIYANLELILFLNKYSNRITLHIIERINSCGIDLLLAYEGKIVIYERATGLYHAGKAYVPVHISTVFEELELAVNANKTALNYFLMFTKGILSNEQTKKLLDGFDILLSNKQLQQLVDIKISPNLTLLL